MSYEIVFTPQFEKDVKYYLKKKKYTKILDDIDEIVTDLEKGIFVGSEIADLKLPSSNSIYKLEIGK
jgi:mRNA-degrading endonuclease RelE of RelBE toxin-antitoxin system